MKCFTILLLLSSLINSCKIYTSAAAASLDDIVVTSENQEGIYIIFEGAKKFFPRAYLSSSVLLSTAFEEAQSGSSQEMSSFSYFKKFYKTPPTAQKILDDISDLLTAANQNNISVYLDTKSEEEISTILLLADTLGLNLEIINLIFDRAKKNTVYPIDTNNIYSVAWSTDGRMLASGSDDGIVRLWDAISGNLLYTLVGHTSAIFSVAFSPDGKYLASGSRDNTIHIWDIATRKSIHRLTAHTKAVYSVVFSPNGKYLASGSEDKTVHIYKTANWTLDHILNGHTQSVNSISFSPDSSLIASGSADETVHLWDSNTGKSKGEGIYAGGYVNGLEFSPNGLNIAVGLIDTTMDPYSSSTIAIIDITKKRRSKLFYGNSRQVSSIAWINNTELASCSNKDSNIYLWDTATEKTFKKFETDAKFLNLAFNPKTKLLAAGSQGKMGIQVFSLQNLQEYIADKKITVMEDKQESASAAASEVHENPEHDSDFLQIDMAQAVRNSLQLKE